MVLTFLIPGFGKGGAQKQIIYLLNELQKQPDLNISVIYFFEGVNFQFLNRDKLTLVKLPLFSFYNPLNLLRVGFALRRLESDIVFSWIRSAHVYAFFARFLRPNVKWIMAERNSRYEGGARDTLRDLVGRRADAIIANSPEGREYWINMGYSKDKIFVVPNILVPPRPTLGDDFSAAAPMVLYAGRLEPQKNVLTIAQAFAMLAVSEPKTRFGMIGDGSLAEQVREVLSASGGLVELMPFQAGIGDYLCAAQVFVNVSLYEGMPNTVMECASVGKQLVVSDISEHRQLLGPEHRHYVNNISDVEELCGCIRSAIAMAGSKPDYASFFSQSFSVMAKESVTKQYRNVFIGVVEGGSGRTRKGAS